MPSQVLRHPLGKGRDKYPLILFDPLSYPYEEIINLVSSGRDNHLRVSKSCGPDDLFGNRLRDLQFIRTGRRGDIDGLFSLGLEFLEFQWPVIKGGGETEAVFHEGVLPGAVTFVHPVQLRNCDMAFIYYNQTISGEIIKQGRRGFAGRPSGEVPGIVLNTMTVTHLYHHLHIKQGAFLDPLCFYIFFLRTEELYPLLKLLPYSFHCLFAYLCGCNIMCGRVYGDAIQFLGNLSEKRIDFLYGLYLIAEKIDADSPILLMGRVDVQDVAPYAKPSPEEVIVSAFVMYIDESLYGLLP